MAVHRGPRATSMIGAATGLLPCVNNTAEAEKDLSQN